MSFSNDWFARHIPVWELVLKDLKGKKLHCVEIGSYEGQASVWLLENILTHPASTLVCVDTWEGSEEHKDIDMAAVKERFDENIKPYEVKVEVEQTTSVDYLKRSYRPADLIYIDGSHTAADCLTDGVLAHLVLKPGGIIIFDDYLWGGLAHAPDVPRGAIDAFTQCYANEYDAINFGQQVILRKKWEA